MTSLVRPPPGLPNIAVEIVRHRACPRQKSPAPRLRPLLLNLAQPGASQLAKRLARLPQKSADRAPQFVRLCGVKACLQRVLVSGGCA